MSDMSMIQRSVGYLPELAPVPPAPPPALPGSRELPLDELEIRHLSGLDEINRVVHLRRAIQLPAATLADPDFASREKKET